MTLLISVETRNCRSGRPRTKISKMYGPGLVADKLVCVDPTPAQIVEFANRPIPVQIRGRLVDVFPVWML